MTTGEKAAAYAERYEARPMAETAIRAYITGATEALASQWRSVEEELPEEDSYILTVSKNGDHSVANFSKGKFINAIQVVAWMPIPSIPDTNTEKK